MAYHKLTMAQVAAAAAPGDKTVKLGDGGGLCLYVYPSGTKNWVLQFTPPGSGKRREMGLGPYPVLDLKAARLTAQKARQLVLDGKDPIDERQQTRIAEVRRGKTFAAVAEEYIALHEEEWKHPRQAAHWRRQIARYADPVLGALPIGKITGEQVLEVLQPIWRTRSGVARTLRSRLDSIFEFAIYKEYRTAANPARWKGRLEHSLPNLARIRPVKNARSLHYRDIGRFVLTLRRTRGVAARAVEFLVLTGARATEVTQMAWSELDEPALWILPPRVKGRREGDGKRDHQVPLVRQALAIIEAMREVETFNGHYVFPGTARGTGDRLGQAMSDWGPLSLIKRLGYHQATVAHGLRATLNSWALDNGVPTEPRKMMLSHVVGNAVEEAYRSTAMIELRRSYNQQWADFVDQEVARAAQIENNRAAEIPANSNRRLLRPRTARV